MFRYGSTACIGTRRQIVASRNPRGCAVPSRACPPPPRSNATSPQAPKPITLTRAEWEAFYAHQQSFAATGLELRRSQAETERVKRIARPLWRYRIVKSGGCPFLARTGLRPGRPTSPDSVRAGFGIPRPRDHRVQSCSGQVTWLARGRQRSFSLRPAPGRVRDRAINDRPGGSCSAGPRLCLVSP